MSFLRVIHFCCRSIYGVHADCLPWFSKISAPFLLYEQLKFNTLVKFGIGRDFHSQAMPDHTHFNLEYTAIISDTYFLHGIDGIENGIDKLDV